MNKHDFCYLYLTCENDQEADKIAEALLKKHLIVCAKKLPIAAKYWWQKKITRSEEILLVMESRLDLFDEVEAAVAKLHSYDIFVLEAVPIARVSEKAKEWMEQELLND